MDRSGLGSNSASTYVSTYGELFGGTVGYLTIGNLFEGPIGPASGWYMFSFSALTRDTVANAMSMPKAPSRQVALDEPCPSVPNVYVSIVVTSGRLLHGVSAATGKFRRLIASA